MEQYLDCWIGAITINWLSDSGVASICGSTLFQLQIPRVCSMYFITNLELLGTIFWRSYQEFRPPNHVMDCEVIFEDVFDVLEMASLKFESFGIIKHLKKDPSEEDAQYAFMKVILHLVNLITELDKNEE